ncbi:hypothetical protein VTI28DRAFT_6036 [Corynascus sepedonium]
MGVNPPHARLSAFLGMFASRSETKRRAKQSRQVESGPEEDRAHPFGSIDTTAPQRPRQRDFLAQGTNRLAFVPAAWAQIPRAVELVFKFFCWWLLLCRGEFRLGQASHRCGFRAPPSPGYRCPRLDCTLPVPHRTGGLQISTRSWIWTEVSGQWRYCG